MGSSDLDRYDLKILQSTPLFGGLSEYDIQNIVGNQSARTYEKGALLFQQGEPASDFFVVMSGWVKVTRTTVEGDEAVIGLFSEGDTFAEAAIFISGTYPANAEVIMQSRLLRISGQTMRRCIRENPDLSLSMLASACRHLKELVEQIEDIKLRSAPQRIAEFLLHLCPKRPCQKAEVDLPYEKALLANRLGMKPESFSRAIGKLKKIGVTVNRDHVQISNIAQLSDFAETGRMPNRGSINPVN